MSSQRFYIETYGCSANVADAEMMAGLLKENLLTPVEEPEDADVSILVTCTVKTVTSHRMRYRIKELTSSNRPLVVAGCMPKTERHLIETLNPDASLLGPEDLDRTVETVTAALRGVRSIHTEGSSSPKLLLPRIRRNPVVGIVEISSGCLGNCAFCQVKIAKGELTSYRPESIMREVKQALQEGCREIWLTSQDNGCYGKDTDTDLPHLLDSILSIEGDFKIRLGMMNPEHAGRLLDSLIPLYRDDRFFKFLHIPVQSGSDRVLKSMRRKHTVEDFVNSAKRFRSEFPFSTLSTDIIVGFPTEKDEEFQQTVDMIREVRPNVVNISRFGARPGTESEDMVPLNPQAVKERSRVLHRAVKEVALQNNRRWIGWCGEVLVDEEVRGAVLGRNFAYRPVVIREKMPLGTVLRIRVVDATSACLVGEAA
ncbi:MAG: tRNA (N(6)-L-threonylcarbamoyladenosine(37)-C(2))-methylthiotransferase [Nitrososphaerales archaeon]